MKRSREEVLRQLKGGLIVSCQALEHEPLYTPEGGIMPLMAKAAANAGAVGIRANSVRDITQIKEKVDLPIIGIIKKDYPGTDLYITVTMKEVDELVACGCDIIAFDGTARLRPDGSSAEDFIRTVRERWPEQLLMADIATYEEGMTCARAGVDFVGTTMSGYTPQSQGVTGVNFELIRRLAQDAPCAVIAEGHVQTPELARRCLEEGAHCVVVGGAITRPQEIAARFVAAMKTE